MVDISGHGWDVPTLSTNGNSPCQDETAKERRCQRESCARGVPRAPSPRARLRALALAIPRPRTPHVTLLSSPRRLAPARYLPHPFSPPPISLLPTPPPSFPFPPHPQQPPIPSSRRLRPRPHSLPVRIPQLAKSPPVSTLHRGQTYTCKADTDHRWEHCSQGRIKRPPRFTYLRATPLPKCLRTPVTSDGCDCWTNDFPPLGAIVS